MPGLFHLNNFKHKPFANNTMHTSTLISVILTAPLTAPLPSLTRQAWRPRKEKCDAALPGVFGGLHGAGAVVSAGV